MATRKTPAPNRKAVTVQKKKAIPAGKKAAPVTKKKAAAAPKKAVPKKAPPKKAAPAVRKPVAAKKAAGKPVAAKKAAPAPKAAAPAAKKPVAKAPPRRLKAVARPPVASPSVRPLGVLPAEARARAVERPAHPTVAHSAAAAARPGKAGKTPPLSGKDLKDLERLLLAERTRVMKEMGHLESTVLKVNPRESAGDLSGYSFHMADAGTDAYEREKAFQFASNEGRLLMDLNEALGRLYRGEYGSCETCGNAIAKARLEAMPTARLCRDCKEKEERVNRPQQ